MKQRLAKKVISAKVQDYKPMVLIPAIAKKSILIYPSLFKHLKMGDLIRIILAVLISILTILFMPNHSFHEDFDHWSQETADKILNKAFVK